jgi:hypothetical protein
MEEAQLMLRFSGLTIFEVGSHPKLLNGDGYRGLIRGSSDLQS